MTRIASLALLLLGCGARSDLSVERDRDGGPVDAARGDAGGRDAGGRDAGPGDAGPLPTCGPGSPRVLARDATFEVEVDDRFVYYSTGQFGSPRVRIRRVPKCGGIPETLFEGQLVSELLLRDGTLYFVTERGVERMRDDGTERTLLYELTRYSVGPIAVGGGFVFFADPAGAPERTLAVPVGGGAPMTVSRLGGFAIDADESRIYFATWEPTGGRIVGVPFPGGPTQTYAMVRETIRDIAVDASHVYWSDSADSAEAEIFRARTDGSGPEEVVFRGSGLPLRLAIGARFLYFTDHVGGRVVRVPIGGGPLEVLDDDVPVAEDIALDEQSVFAISFEAEELIKIARPD